MDQGYNDRMDEKLGMKNGAEDKMMQPYEARRDESRGMGGGLGHATMPRKIDLSKANCDKKGYSREALDYGY